MIEILNAINKWFKKGVARFNNSQYAWPVTFIILFLLGSGAAVYFFEINNNDQFQHIADGFWWSIITLSTTGYGDKVPSTFGGQIVTVINIIMGVAAMSFLSGVLASVFVDRSTKARRGLLDFPNLKKHFIICGWKDHMQDILLDIIDVSENLTSDKIVIISNVKTEEIEKLKDIKHLEGIKFVRGDYFSEAALKRANVHDAQKVLILSDTYESNATSEVDSKTVMAVMTIKGMAKDVYTCAELLDKKYEPYLKQAMCDEILFSRDFARRMLATTTATNGMAHIMFELLHYGGSNSKISVFEIPKEFVGKSYVEYKEAFSGMPKTVLLGILENTGSPNKMKIEALREAQKTSDVSMLVSNLQQVKGLEVNKPVFLPEDEYVIQNHSRAIALEKD